MEITSKSYVWVKFADNSAGFKTDGYDESLTSVTLYNYYVYTDKDFNKLCVQPGEVTFTLVDNGDDTLTLSYEISSEPPAGPHYEAAESVEAGDKILYVVEYNGANYAMTNDVPVNNALGVAEVTINEDGYIETAPTGASWILETGTASGSFVLKDENGLYIYDPSGTTLKLSADKSDFTATCGNGTAGFDLVTTSATARRIFMRDNNPMQFRCYATSNMSGDGYCAVLTIYKYVP